MNLFHLCTQCIRAVYHLVSIAVSMVFFILGTLWILGSVLIPWLALIFLVVYIGSRCVRFRRFNSHTSASTLLNDNGEDTKYPIIYHAGTGFDAPDNSLSAINMCTKLNCQHIIMNLERMADEWVVLNRLTLEKGNIKTPNGLHEVDFQSVGNFNVSEHHPLGKNFPPERVLTLGNLISEVAKMEVTIFIICSPAIDKFKDLLSGALAPHIDTVQQKFVFISRNPLTIYHLRAVSQVTCGLWIDRSRRLKVQPYWATYDSIKNTFLRLIAPFIGIQVVFIHKSEFNENIADLWRQWTIRPVVYPVNTPNEKRYFQRIVKTQYLTETLRTEIEVIKSSINLSNCVHVPSLQ